MNQSCTYDVFWNLETSLYPWLNSYFDWRLKPFGHNWQIIDWYNHGNTQTLQLLDWIGHGGDSKKNTRCGKYKSDHRFFLLKLLFFFKKTQIWHLLCSWAEFECVFWQCECWSWLHSKFSLRNIIFQILKWFNKHHQMFCLLHD